MAVISARSKKPNSDKLALVARLMAPFFIFLLVFSCGMMFERTNTASRGLVRLPQLVASSDCNENDNMNNNDEGWRSIEVFYGQIQKPTFGVKRLWFSQAQQDQLVFGLLRNQRDGFFIDLAANDAVHFSNTFTLERSYGWKGICIEPNPAYWDGFARHRTCKLAAAIVGAQRMDQVKFQFRGVMGGIVTAPNKNVPEKELEKLTPMYTVPLSEILTRMNAPPVIDYLSLDVEGAEFFIMKQFPLESYRIKILTVERPNDDLKKLLVDNGYQMVLKVTEWGETLWVNKYYLKELDMSILEPAALTAIAPEAVATLA